MLRLALCLLVMLATAHPAWAVVSFRNEVMAVLSRAGCNSGACHGNLNGKGGFRLSLRGQDADFDFTALTRNTLARRIDRHRPADSLLLAKATMSAPHEGGQRFSRNSSEYAILQGWIAGGARLDARAARPTRLRVEWMAGDQRGTNERPVILHDPVDRLTLTVKATFSDGSTRDVSRLACFEPSTLLVRADPSGLVQRLQHGETAVLVRYLDQQTVVSLAFIPARPGFVWKEPDADNVIDRHILAKLRLHRIEPSGLCTDGEFVRRAYLDTLGLLPTPTETRRFLAETSPGKRRRLVEGLVRRNEFADFWALKWSDLLRNEEKVLDARGVRAFHTWIRRAILDGKPLNTFARDLIASRGSTYSRPAANFYRALRDPTARAEATAQVFLGVRLQCAKCHNHPFDKWTQSDYHRFAAFFPRVQYRILSNNRRDKLDKHEFDGEQVVYMDRTTELTDPVSGDVLHPRFLGDDAPVRADRLAALADWVAKPDNPFFARAQANRVWQHLMGRGLVDPGDDFRDSNPPSHPELLDDLARDFAAAKFDLRSLVVQIMTSRAYQRSARPTATNRDDEANYARCVVRPLQAEQLLDAVSQVCGVEPRYAGFPRGTRAGQLPGVGANRRRSSAEADGEKFLAVFGKPVRSLSCECERGEDTTLAQAFQLLTGPVVQRLLAEPNNRIGKLLDANTPTAAIVEDLYLAALCRLPTPQERLALCALVEKSDRSRREALEDVLAGLLNAKEFLLRR
jgi:Protein of unknown function (DUF1553)/Protein of unknown function (DUF1549)